jgi:uncharacterized protein (DUF2252 family)
MARRVTQAPDQPGDTSDSPAAEPIEVRHPSLQERASAGRAARKKTPRLNQAILNAQADRPDPVALLEEQGKTRLPELLPIRYGRMLASPFAFYRGAAAIMAGDLAHTPDTGLQVQLCGDAHLANFGGFASPERDLVFDINDFDETLPGPWEWDLKRLATSFEIAGRERGFKKKECRTIVLTAVAEYRRAMAEFAVMSNLDVWYSLLDEARMVARWGATAKPKVIKAFSLDFAVAHSRDNARAFEKLTWRVDGRLQLVSTPPLVVSIAELLPQADSRSLDHELRMVVRKFRQSLQSDRRHLLEKYEVVDIARKVVGVGSVGLRSWIVLLVGPDEKDTLFLQYKEAQASVLEAHLGKNPYTAHGRRVVEGQRLMQAVSDIFLGWDSGISLLDHIRRDFYVRQLMDWKLSINTEIMTPGELSLYGQMCGWTLARAHARSGDGIALTAYLGNSDLFDQALADFASAYADQNERDFQALTAAAKSGRIKAETGI